MSFKVQSERGGRRTQGERVREVVTHGGFLNSGVVRKSGLCGIIAYIWLQNGRDRRYAFSYF